MSDTVIRIENLSKQYRLGEISGKTLRDEVSRWWAKRTGKPNPLAKVDKQHLPTNGKAESIWALKDISFEVKQGEVLGIIGRNGAGKSTLLKILSRVTSPTSGQVRVRGRIASLLEVGTGFHPELTGRENIYLNGAILGMTKAEIRSKFDEIVAFAEVEKFIDTPVKRYSSGMYVRLAFAVAAHLEPEILIVDEVLAVGDADFQKKCLGKMKDVAGEGRTVLFVSHNMDAILRLCPVSILLNKGVIESDGESRNVVGDYATRRVKQESAIDLRGMVRAQNVRLKAKCLAIRMVGSATSDNWQIGYGEQLGFEIVVEASNPLSGLELGVSLFTATGVEITSNLSSHCITPEIPKAGRYIITATYDNLRLVPGRYYLQLGLRSDIGFEDFIARGCEFDVLSTEVSSTNKVDTFRGALVPVIHYEFRSLK